jgi:hypothetical protein
MKFNIGKLRKMCREKRSLFKMRQNISDTLCIDVGMYVVVAGNIILPLNSSSEMVLRCRITEQVLTS